MPQIICKIELWSAKLTVIGAQSVVCDYFGIPLELYDERGRKTWQAELDSYGAVHRLGIPQDYSFGYQCQYEDVEMDLYYNHFRYYDPETGSYISQDPIGVASGECNLYATSNPNRWVDVLGPSSGPTIRPII